MEFLGDMLTIMYCRGTEVDEGQSETQSSGFLDGIRDEKKEERKKMECILCVYHTLCIECGDWTKQFIHALP